MADEGIPVVLACRVLGFSKQAYFKWRANPIRHRDWDDAHLNNAAVDIHHDDPSRLPVHHRRARRQRRQGVRNRVNRLGTAQRMWSVHSRKRCLNRRPGPPVHDDRVLRRFTAQRPNELWLTHITEHPTTEGKPPLRGQGRLLQPHRRLPDGQPHDGRPGGPGSAARRRSARAGGIRRALRPRQPVCAYVYVRALRGAQCTARWAASEPALTTLR